MREWQFHHAKRLTLAAPSYQVVCFRKPIFGRAKGLPFDCNKPQVPSFSEFMAKKTAAKPQFTCTQQSRKENGGVCHPADKPNLIRIFSRDSGQHMLANQSLVGISSQLFAIDGFLALAAAKRPLAATVCFSGFGPQSQ
jgi:hypothetical protein